IARYRKRVARFFFLPPFLRSQPLLRAPLGHRARTFSPFVFRRGPTARALFHCVSSAFGGPRKLRRPATRWRGTLRSPAPPRIRRHGRGRAEALPRGRDV